jgi:hypothetical protein
VGLPGTVDPSKKKLADRLGQSLKRTGGAISFWKKRLGRICHDLIAGV